MATVIDALLVTLGLDSRDFQKGQKDAADSQEEFRRRTEKDSQKVVETNRATTKDFQKGQKEAGDSQEKFRKRTEEDSKKVGEQARAMAEGFNRVKGEILSLVAVAIGGKALKDFMSDTTRTNFALGMSARNLNMSAGQLKAWQAAAVTAGGTAEGLTNTMQGLASAIEARDQGKPGEAIVMMARMGVNFDEKDYGKLLLDISEKMRRLPAQTQLFAAQGLGIDQGTMALLLRDDMGELIKTMASHTQHTDEAVAASKRLTESFGQFYARIGDVGDRLYKNLAPALESTLKLVNSLLDKVLEFDDKSGGWVSKILAGSLALIAMGGALKTVLVVWRALAAISGGGAAAAGAAAAGGAGAAGAAAGGAGASWLARAMPWLARLGVGASAVLHSGELNSGEDAELARLRARGDAALGIPGAAGLPGMPGSPGLPGAPGAAGGANLPRGVRNNNPGNLEYRGQAGAVPEPGPGRFAAFKTMEEGFAALYKQLQLYEGRGIDTLREIVNKYAPASENNVGAYIAALSKSTGLGADDKVDLTNSAQVAALLKGIANHENGRGYVNDQQVSGGIRLGAGANAGVAAARGGNTINSETRIGTVNVNMPNAQDAKGFARELPAALNDNSLVPTFMTGVN